MPVLFFFFSFWIMGHKHLWMLKAALEEPAKDQSLVEQAAAG
jgi:hypothetical protein